MSYTRDDHRRQPLRYPICSEGHVWKQRGNRTGHCSSCHETFEGITLFDAHQRMLEGRPVCLDPEMMFVGHEQLRFEDGSWRGPRMPAGVFHDEESEI